MIWRIPNFQNATVQAVELSLNMEISAQRYNEVADAIIAYLQQGAPERMQTQWGDITNAIADLILFDKRKLTGEEFANLIHGEWATLDQIARYTAMVMSRIGKLESHSSNQSLN